ncbi:MAG: MG2 domain-containing protein [Prolixibacteraceae bacterium]|jgi:hypothetical protein|nr:MG2 domain-containing protein [Prolixibacteraceae bacterium]
MKILKALIFIAVLLLFLQCKGQSAGFDKQFTTADSLSSEGLPRQALGIYESIYKQAKAERNQEVLVRAIVERSRSVYQIEEEPLVKLIGQLLSDVEEIDEPARQIVHSQIAELYWEYFSRNRWRILKRTAVEDSEEQDMRKWDISRLAGEMLLQINLSLKNAEKLQITPVDDFSSLLRGDSTLRNLRSTLYDQLVFRALEIIKNPHLGIDKPVEAFHLNDEQYFNPATEFVKIKITTTDTLSLRYQCISLYQNITAFRLNQNNNEALADLELNRISYVSSNSQHPQKDSLTIRFYDRLISHTKHGEAKAEVMYRKALYLHKMRITSDKNNLDEAVELCRKVIADYPGSKVAGLCANIIKSIETPELLLYSEYSELPGKPFRVLVRWKNIDSVQFSMYKISAEDASNYMNQYWYKEGDFEHLPVVKTWMQHLPDVAGYDEHSVEVPVDGAPKGFYLLVASYNNNADSVSINRASVMQFTSLSLMNREMPGKRLFVVGNAETGRPIGRATIELKTRKRNQTTRQREYEDLASLKTNFAGEVVYEPANQSINRIVVSHKGDTLISSENIYVNNEYTTSNKQPEVIFYTDRAIYRPGQTVHFKGIVLRKNDEGHQIVKQHRETVLLRDVNYQKIGNLDLVSNDYGTFSGSFTLPRSGLNGSYSLQCKSGRTNIRVEAYRRPTFEVLFNNIEKSYGFDDTVTLTGFVKSYSGSPIGNADVNYHIVRAVAYPFRWIARSGQQIVETGLVKTEADGSFELSFKTMSENIENFERIYVYKVLVDASAPGGETQSNQYELRISRSNLFIDCKLPDVIKKDDFDGLNIQATNLNGDQIEASGVLAVYELIPPGEIMSDRYWETPDVFLLDSVAYKSKFPHFPYKNESKPENWRKGRKIVSKNIEIKPDNVVYADEWLSAGSGYYRVEIEAKTDEGKNSATWHKMVRMIGEKPLEAETLSDWVTVTKSKGEPGETIEIWLSSINRESPVRYELVKDKELLESDIINPGKRVYRLLIPIEQAYKGNVVAQFTQVANNREYHRYVTIEVPQTDNKLNISLQTFRDQLMPGEHETWSLSISDNSGKGIAAEMVASLYDASLDQFKKHDWNTSFSNKRANKYYRWRGTRYGITAHNMSYIYFKNRYPEVYMSKHYEELVLFNPNANFGSGSGDKIMIRGVSSVQKTIPISRVSVPPAVAEDLEVADEAEVYSIVEETPEALKRLEKNNFSNVKIRENFNETAFFYPHLYSDKDGKLEVSFTIPEAITRWRLMGFAHTEDFIHGSIEAELVTRKNVSVEPYAPRFLREGDTLFISATVRNLTHEKLSGTALLQITDALTFKPLTAITIHADSLLNFEVEAQSAEVVRWKMIVPWGLQAITYKVMARAGNHSDGEQKMLPVLSNRMLVTESMPFVVRGGDERAFHFKKMSDNNSSTLKNHLFTIEYTSNPVWYAIQALPYLMEYPYDCAEQVFSRFYANAAASALMNSSPRIKAVFDAWEELDADAFLSNLEKNSELKSVLLEESPWLLQAQSESEMKKRLSLLFDLNRMGMELTDAFIKLQQMQLPDGSFPWFAEMPGNRYITQYIVSGMSELQKLGAVPSELGDRWRRMRRNAMGYLDKCVSDDYKKRLERNEDNSTFFDRYKPTLTELHYLYAHSFEVTQLPGKDEQQAFDFLLKQAEKQWLKYDEYAQGLMALTFHRFDIKEMAERIVKSLADRALRTEGDGMRWANNKHGYYWHQAPVETQALLINVFDEVADDDQSVEEMKIWLLRNKQTNHWGNTKATVAACNALLNTGQNRLEESRPIEVELAGKPLSLLRDIKVEAGTGYVKTSFAAGEIKPELAKIQVKNPNQGVAWGAAYWQYFEQLDKITSASTDVEIDKQLFVKRKSDTGEMLVPLHKQSVKIGDQVVVRIVIETERDMEFVHLKDMRASGFEPTTTISGYTWTDGLGYYRETKDAAMNFFIANMSKGVYVFEYSLRASHTGQFSNGITTLQCMYAPEFTTHSKGQRIIIE